MAARGAQKHARKSTLARFMIERASEMHRLVEVDRYSWADIAAMLTDDEGLTDRTGGPVTATIAKLTWSRLRATTTPKTRRQTVTAPAPQAAETVPNLPAPSRPARDLPVPAPDPGAEPPHFDIRPASPHQPPPRGATPSRTQMSPLDEARAQQQNDDNLTTRLAGRKIPPARVL
jgi:hypothetical protein